MFAEKVGNLGYGTGYANLLNLPEFPTIYVQLLRL